MEMKEWKWIGMDLDLLRLTSCTSSWAAACGRGAGASKPTTAPKAARRGASSRRPTPGASPPTNSRTPAPAPAPSPSSSIPPRPAPGAGGGPSPSPRSVGRSPPYLM